MWTKLPDQAALTNEMLLEQKPDKISKPTSLRKKTQSSEVGGAALSPMQDRYGQKGGKDRNMHTQGTRPSLYTPLCMIQPAY
jgi:hypothetical protein